MRVLNLEQRALRDAWRVQQLVLVETGALGADAQTTSLAALDPGPLACAAAALAPTPLIAPEQQPHAVALLQRLGEWVQAADDWQRGEALRPKAGEPGSGEVPQFDDFAVVSAREVLEQVRDWLGKRPAI
jgi:hypothetical protein